MTTEEATQILAMPSYERPFILHPDYQHYAEESLRAIHAGLSEVMSLATQHGRNWSWEAAQAALDRAYAILGAKNPGTGYQWHCGEHPIQLVWSAAK